MLFGWFTKKYTLLVEIGNYMTYATVVQERVNQLSIVEQVGVVTFSCKDGVIRNSKEFVSSLKELVGKLNIKSWNKVVVGFDSSHIKCHGFSNISLKNKEVILEEIALSFPNQKVVFQLCQEELLTVLTMQRNLLTHLYNCFEEAGIQVNSFIPIKYYYAAYIEQIHNEYKDILMVINLGYRSTNITVFTKGFPISYRTIYLGVENVVLAIADKCQISIEDAKSIIKTTPVLTSDTRQWINCSGSQLNQKQVADALYIYYCALIQKILHKDLAKVSHAVLIGWSNQIPDIEDLFSGFIPNVLTAKEADLRCMQQEIISLLN
jgi:cell division ATPase FtsA